MALTWPLRDTLRSQRRRPGEETLRQRRSGPLGLESIARRRKEIQPRDRPLRGFYLRFDPSDLTPAAGPGNASRGLTPWLRRVQASPGKEESDVPEAAPTLEDREKPKSLSYVE